MTTIEELIAREEIKEAKFRYCRGVDTAEKGLVLGVLADDCELDYVGCFTDPATGEDFFPAMNIVLRGKDSWTADGMKRANIRSFHVVHNSDIGFISEAAAKVIWSMTDRMFVREGGTFRRLTGHGYYHETYEKIGGRWKIKTLRIERMLVEAETRN
jgi:hypothetical protein